MSALPPPPVGIIVHPAQLEQAEAIVRQLQHAMRTGGGSAYVSFIPEQHCHSEKAPPVSNVDSLIDTVGTPLPETDVMDLGELNQQLQTISEES